jgi:hypothetical protein
MLTRLFLALPAVVPLSAIGSLEPLPSITWKRLGSTPLFFKYSATELARPLDNSTFEFALPTV